MSDETMARLFAAFDSMSDLPWAARVARNLSYDDAMRYLKRQYIEGAIDVDVFEHCVAYRMAMET